tara:strand:+ start:94 stop:681 length:588 start_codon:yes stop_codon:yes gene_type:complete
MRIFIIVIILIFSLQSLSKADNITEFEIEGISLYDSALLYFSKNDLKDDVAKYYTSDKFSTSTIWKSFEKYDYLQLSFKKNDSKYIIQDLTGNKRVSYLDCLEELKDIENIISNLYENSSDVRNDGKRTYDHPADKSGESKITDVAWYFNSGDAIVAQCYNWDSDFGRQNNQRDNLAISISNKEIDTWFTGEAYE